DRLADHRELGRLGPHALLLELPEERRVELHEPLHPVVLGGEAERLLEPAALVGEDVAAVEHRRVPEDVGEEDGDLAAGVEAELAPQPLRPAPARAVPGVAGHEPLALLAPGELRLERPLALLRPAALEE